MRTYPSCPAVSAALRETLLSFKCNESGGLSDADYEMVAKYDVRDALENTRALRELKGNKDGSNVATFTNKSKYD